jgi:hypothetical protein
MKNVAIVLLLLINVHVFAQQGKPDNIKTFIPPDYELLHSKTGDLNKDSYPDMVLILKAKEEKVNEDLPRPLILLVGTATSEYKLIARNDSVVLCKGCGGVHGDPYEGITIKNGYFSIEHYGGSGWRWTRIITFKYDSKTKEFKLHRDAGVSYHIGNANKQKDERHNKEDWGKLSFIAFNNEKLFAKK